MTDTTILMLGGWFSVGGFAGFLAGVFLAPRLWRVRP